MARVDRAVLLPVVLFALLGLFAIRLVAPAVAKLAHAFQEMDAAYESIGRGWYRPSGWVGEQENILFYWPGSRRCWWVLGRRWGWMDVWLWEAGAVGRG